MPSADHDLGPQDLQAPARPRTALPPGRSPEHAEPSRFIPHVQGLRAIAVLLVVLYHFWPGRLPGGYVGVDVFFVISGYLITAHLWRELSLTGGVRLAQFWARRARRLLPASLLVLLFCALAVMSPYVMPTSALQREVKEIIAATFYVENWYLALTSADYLNHTGSPSTVQHYWSLSLEEQFYLMWPLLMLAAVWLAVRFMRQRRRTAVIVLLAVVSAASFAFCVAFTHTDPAPAYFVTFGRMWEFGLGGLLALLPGLHIRHRWLSFALGWAGIAALVYTAFRFDGQTPFPGSAAALPVAGALAVIAASNTERWWQPTRILSVRPAQFTGDISYSLYLWHWPLIIIAPSVPFWGLTIYHRVALLVFCFVIAWLTKRFIEDPMRHWKPLTRRPARVSLFAALGAMLLVAGAAGAAWAVNAPAYRDGVQQIQQVRANPPACFGAASVLDPSCASADFGERILPAPGFAGADAPDDGHCFVQLNNATPVECDFGSNAPDAPRVILIGDSHAYQMLDTVKRIADAQGWHLTTFFKGACPWSATPLDEPGAFGVACTQWRHAVAERMRVIDADVVFTSALATTAYDADGFVSPHAAAVAGYRAAWKSELDRGTRIVTIVDNPHWETDPNKCLRTRPMDSCAGARSEMLVEHDPLRDAAEGQKGVTLLDFTNAYCDKTRCFPVVGGANLYRDQDHLTVTWVDTLAPWIRDALAAAIAERGR